MMAHDITNQVGPHRRRRRIGRGESSGWGKTSGRGHKGMGQRSGGGPHSMHEGGAIPLYQRMPKVGFNNYNFRRDFDVVNLHDLERACEAGAKVAPDDLARLRLTRADGRPVKLLGKGKLTKKLVLTVHACSAAAKAAVEQAGGSVELITLRDPVANWRAKRRKAKPTPRTERVSRLQKKKTRSGE